MSQSNVVFATNRSATRADLFARAEDISADLSRRAAELDREGRPPLAEIVKLKNAGLLNALHGIPCENRYD